MPLWMSRTTCVRETPWFRRLPQVVRPEGSRARLKKSAYTWVNQLWFGVMVIGAALMVRVAAVLVAETLLASVTTARYAREPAVAKPSTVKGVAVAPATPLPLLRPLKVTPLYSKLSQIPY